MRLPQYECPICGKIWKRETARLQEAKTCTKKCASIKGYLSGDRKETGIELKIQEMLRSLAIDFVVQKPLLGITIADVFIYPNVAIFADGDYWHKGEDKEYRDMEKTKSLEKHRYIVLRLTETEINKDPENTLEKIKIAYGKRRASREL